MKLQRDRNGFIFYEMDAAAFNRMARQARQERDQARRERDCEQGRDDGKGTAA